MSIFTGSQVRVAKRGKVLEVRGYNWPIGLVLAGTILLELVLLSWPSEEGSVGDILANLRTLPIYVLWPAAAALLLAVYVFVFGYWRVRVDGENLTLETVRRWGFISKRTLLDCSAIDLFSEILGIIPGSYGVAAHVKGKLWPQEVHTATNELNAALVVDIASGLLGNTFSPHLHDIRREMPRISLRERLTGRAKEKWAKYGEQSQLRMEEHRRQTEEYCHRLGVCGMGLPAEYGAALLCAVRGVLGPKSRREKDSLRALHDSLRNMWPEVPAPELVEDDAPGSSKRQLQAVVGYVSGLPGAIEALRRLVPAGLSPVDCSAFLALMCAAPNSAEEFVVERAFQALVFYEETGVINPLKAILRIAARAGSPALPRAAAPLLDHDSAEVRRLALVALLLAAPEENSPEAGAIRQASTESRDPALRRQARTALEWLANGAGMSA